MYVAIPFCATVTFIAIMAGIHTKIYFFVLLVSLGQERGDLKWPPLNEHQYSIIVTGPVKTGHICTNYTCSEKGTFLRPCV